MSFRSKPDASSRYKSKPKPPLHTTFIETVNKDDPGKRTKIAFSWFLRSFRQKKQGAPIWCSLRSRIRSKLRPPAPCRSCFLRHDILSVLQLRQNRLGVILELVVIGRFVYKMLQ